MGADLGLSSGQYQFLLTQVYVCTIELQVADRFLQTVYSTSDTSSASVRAFLTSTAASAEPHPSHDKQPLCCSGSASRLTSSSPASLSAGEVSPSCKHRQPTSEVSSPFASCSGCAKPPSPLESPTFSRSSTDVVSFYFDIGKFKARTSAWGVSSFGVGCSPSWLLSR